MSGAREAVIAVRGLGTRFGPQVVHRALDLDLWRGEVLGVVGGSGSGKSVLLRTITGLNIPVAGSVKVFGTEVGGAAPEALAALETRWGVMFQDGALFSALTVRENVEVPLRGVEGLPEGIRRELADLKIAMVGLPPEAGDKYPAELSGGMRKRGGRARALARDPELLFLDEPTAGLDPIGAAAFDRLLVDLAGALGLTVFLVTHDLDTLIATASRVAVLAEGRVLVEGTMEAMRTVDHPWVREYFQGPRARAARASHEGRG
ncbi:MAG: ABC transporter ATP-binding protein [Gemmobacter sp.]